MKPNNSFFNPKRLVFEGPEGGASKSDIMPTPDNPFGMPDKHEELEAALTAIEAGASKKPDFADKAAREKLFADVENTIKTLNPNSPKSEADKKTLEDYMGLAQFHEKNKAAAKAWAEKLYTKLMAVNPSAVASKPKAAPPTRAEIAGIEAKDYLTQKRRELPQLVELQEQQNGVQITPDEVEEIMAAAKGPSVETDEQFRQKVSVDQTLVRYDSPHALFRTVGCVDTKWMGRMIISTTGDLAAGPDTVKAISVPTPGGEKVVIARLVPPASGKGPGTLRFYLPGGGKEA